MNCHGRSSLKALMVVCAALLMSFALASDVLTSEQLQKSPEQQYGPLLRMLRSELVVYGTIKNVNGTVGPALEVSDARVVLGSDTADLDKTLTLNAEVIPDGTYILAANPEWTHVRNDNPHPKRITAIRADDLSGVVGVKGLDDAFLKALISPAKDNPFRYENWEKWSQEHGIRLRVTLINAGEPFLPSLQDPALLPQARELAIRVELTNSSKETLFAPKGILLDGLLIVALREDGRMERQLNGKPVRDTAPYASPDLHPPALEWIELAPGAVFVHTVTGRDLVAPLKFSAPGKYQVFAIAPLRQQKQELAAQLKVMPAEQQEMIPYSAWAQGKSPLGKAAFDANVLGELVTYTVVDPAAYKPKDGN